MVNNQVRTGYARGTHNGWSKAGPEKCVCVRTVCAASKKKPNRQARTASAHLHSSKKQTAAQTSSSEAAVAC